MLKRKNKKALPEQLENSLYPDDYWLDKEDGQEVSEPLPDGENPVSGKLRKEPMVTGYETLERQRGVRRPKRKITRREKKALKQAQKYEAKLRKEQERADKKSEKREAKLAEKTEKEAMRQAKKDAKKRKSKPASTSGQKATGSRKPVKTGTNKTAVKADTAKEKQISAQQSIPYHEMAKDGICRVQDKFYSKTIRFYDINYQLAQNEDKNAIFENWCDFLNYFDSTIHFQLSFINQHSNMVEFEKVILIKPQDDEFDELRMEFAQMLKNQLSKGNNGLLRTKYITFGIEADSIREAKPKLERIESDILNNFKILGVSAYPLNGEERLQIMYETFNQDSKVPFHFSYDDVLRTGLSTKDYVAPTSFVFKNGRDFQMGGTIGAVSYLQILAPELTDKMLAEFLEMDCNLMVNLHIQSIDQMKAIKLVKSKVTDINRMKIEEQKKAVRSGYDMDIIPSDLNTYGGEAKRLACTVWLGAKGVKASDLSRLLLKEEQTAAYSVEIWKRFRKWGGIPTGITQNVKDLLASREIENIFENSDFILMLNQASGDRQILAKQLNISPHQLSYVTNSGEGEGLVFYGSTIIPFKDKFDNSLMLYALMTSKPDEVEKRKRLGIGERDEE